MSERVRYMRLFVFFDLPMESSAQRKEYARFRKYLLTNGYLMLQKSVYTKLVIDARLTATFVERLRQNAPAEGIVQALQVTEKQYANMCLIAGHESRGSEIESTDTLVVL